MLSFLQYITESSRSEKRLLRKIQSPQSSPEQISGWRNADWLRDQSRGVVRGIKNYLATPEKFTTGTTTEILRSGDVTDFKGSTILQNPEVEKMRETAATGKDRKQYAIQKAVEKKYPASYSVSTGPVVSSHWQTAQPTRTGPDQPSGTQGVIHKTLAQIDPEGNARIVTKLKKLNLNTDSIGADNDERVGLGTAIAQTILNPVSGTYAYDPTRTAVKMAWRRRLGMTAQTAKAAQKNPLDGVGSEGT